MRFEDYLSEQFERHPSMQPQDVVKMCYQAARGAEHLLTDPGRAKQYLEREYASVTAVEGELYEPISDKVCRVNLTAWKAKGLPIEWLFRMFVNSAKIAEDGRGLLAEYLKRAETVLFEEPFPNLFYDPALSNGPECRTRPVDTEQTEKDPRVLSFTAEEWSAFLCAYEEAGMPAVHHSERYRDCEHPAYRIINRSFCELIPILVQINSKITVSSDVDAVFTIAIDGRAASGKTTLAQNLRLILDADVVQMDDFFLPPALRTPERLTEAGGNVHYERFAEEVLPFLLMKKAFAYRVFDCASMDFSGLCEIGEKQFCIVEGSYSTHPLFGAYADLTVFSDVAPEEQVERIRKRNGEAMLERFRSMWIPMEETYFEVFGRKEAADLVVSSIRS